MWTIIWAVAAFYLCEVIRRVLWGIINYFSDQYLRRDGWDEDEEFIPMVDYIPFWRLFRGTDDLVPHRMRTRRRMF